MVRSGAALLPPSVPGLRVERPLGTGPQSTVWLVSGTAGLQALKVPLPDAQGMPYGSFVSRRELNIQSRLEHENLLRVHSVVETSSGPGLLMDYAPGGSLGALAAARGALTVGECITILVAAAQGLAYLHGQGLVHGNLSPSNVLFTADGRPVLADAGTGHQSGSGKRAAVPAAETPMERGGRHVSGGRQDTTPSVQPPGPPPPPDPVQGAGAGAAEDILSLSALGWYLLTGHVPPEARERPPLAVLVPGAGYGLAALIDAGLAADPRARPSAAVFAAEAYRSGPPAPVKLPASPQPGLPGGQQPSATARRATKERATREPAATEPAATRARRRGRTGSAGRAAAGTVLPVSPSGPSARPAAGSGDRKRSRFLLPFGMLLVAATILLAAVLIVAPERLGLTPGDAAADAAPSTPEASSTAGDAAKAAADKAAADKAAADKAAADKAAADKAVADQAAADKAAALAALQEQAKSPDPAVAVQGLVGLRATAFRTADSGLLNAVNAFGSPAMAADAGELEKLVQAGTVLAGLEVTLDKVALSGQLPPGAAAAEGQRVSVTVTVTTSAYSETDAAGKVVRTSSEPRSQDAVLVLIGSEGGWKIERVLPASG